MLPEVEAARENNFVTLGRVAGFRPRALRSIRSSIGTNQSNTLDESIIIPASGYFRVIVNAIADRGAPIATDAGESVQNDSHEELWFYVSPHGGRTSREFDPSIVPDSMIARPGLQQLKAKFRPRVRATSLAPSGARLSLSVPSGPRYTLLDPGVRQVTYYNEDTQTYDPIPNLSIRFQEWDPMYNVPAGGGYLGTDENGEFTEPCPSDNGGSYNNTMEGTISTDDYWATVSYGGSTTISGWNGDPYSCQDQSEPWIVGNSKLARVFVNMNRLVQASQSAFSHSIVQTQVYISSGTSTAYYSTGTHSIYMNNSGTYIWGDYGRFVPSHEFGHKVHNVALGSSLNTSNCNPHYLDSPSSLSCAWVEGFADYHAAVMEGSGNSYGGAIISNSYFTGSSYTDGSVIESSVASLIYHQPSSISMTTQQVASTLASCQLHYTANTVATGVDDFVYCLERTIDSSVQSSYFSGRSGTLASYIYSLGPQPSGWSQSTVRSTWLHDLYKQ
ncbi:MAG: hypothetical protein M3Z17_02115 [Gemmatimonadota bacterium]|nr:hypothetical protein [Gemmatimonadota bacterium]